MKLEKLARVKDLLTTAKKLGNMIDLYKEKVAMPRIDKHGLSFGATDRFEVFRAHITLNSHYGEYGSSSCYTLTDVPNKDAQEFLVRALNKNMKLILDDMAAFAAKDAADLKSEAQEEIDLAVAMLESLSA